jgi:hypothetical protein
MQLGVQVADFQAFRPDPKTLARQSSESRAALVVALARVGRNVPVKPADVQPYVTERELSSRLPNTISRVYVVTGHQSEAFDDFYGALAEAQRPMIERRSVSLGTANTPAEIAVTLAAIPSASDHVIVVVRGGGSRGEDLWAFDHPDVVNAIVATRNPVLTALGHRGNVFWADHAAAASMPVPGVLGQAMRVALRQRNYATRKARLSASTGMSAPQSHAITSTRGPRVDKPPQQSERAARPAPSAPLYQPPQPTYPIRPIPAAPIFPAGGLPSLPQWSWGTAPVRRPRGFGVASLVLGLISAFVAGGFIVLPIVGLILGTLDLRRRPRKAAIAGVIINSLILTGAVLFFLFMVAAGSNVPSPSPS